MSTCVIPKEQSQRCLSAARNKLLRIRQTEKLSRADEAITEAIVAAVNAGQIERHEVIGKMSIGSPSFDSNIGRIIVTYLEAASCLALAGWQIVLRSPHSVPTGCLTVWLKGTERIVTIDNQQTGQWELFEKSTRSVTEL